MRHRAALKQRIHAGLIAHVDLVPGADEAGQDAPIGEALVEVDERLRLGDRCLEGMLGGHLLYVPGALGLAANDWMLLAAPSPAGASRARALRR
jgi:hypothetical protein